MTSQELVNWVSLAATIGGFFAFEPVRERAGQAVRYVGLAFLALFAVLAFMILLPFMPLAHAIHRLRRRRS